MKQIPIVEEILVKHSVFMKPEISNFNLIIHRDCFIEAQRNIKKAMIEFAQLHVKAALEAASENIKYDDKYIGMTGEFEDIPNV